MPGRCSQGLAPLRLPQQTPTAVPLVQPLGHVIQVLQGKELCFLLKTTNEEEGGAMMSIKIRSGDAMV